MDEDDAAMESSFAQVQREEYISKKIGNEAYVFERFFLTLFLLQAYKKIWKT